jgi:DNA-directed RNA polymerase specialized sigma24 family protein
MPKTQRDAVLLRVVEELPYAAIAKRLGCSEAAVRIKVMRALNALSRTLRGDSP